MDLGVTWVFWRRMTSALDKVSERRTMKYTKQMERVGKSLPVRTLCDVFGMQARLRVLTQLSHVRRMAVGTEAPTIIQPPLYKARFTNAMERYFTTVPSKWTSI